MAADSTLELALPDLPEVPIQIAVPGAAAPRVRRALGLRVRDGLTTYLPLLMMVLLALGTWWLVKHSPGPLPAKSADAPVRTEPDYTMTGFTVQRYGADGRLLVRLEGRQLRHFPATDRTEIESVTVHAWATDGRETVATAQRALANGDASEVQLLGGAQVRSRTPEGAPVALDSDFLQLFTRTERVTTPQAVTVRVGASELHAAGLTFDNLQRKLDLAGPMRGTFPPRAAGGGR